MSAIDDVQAVRDDAGREGRDPRKELAYNESLRALTQQASVLDALRTRTGILLAALSVAATFLGSKGLADDSLTGFGLAGICAFAVAALAALGVLLPRDKWEFSMDANTIIDGYIEDPDEPASLDEMHLEFARLNQNCFEENRRRLGWLFWSFRISVAGLAVSIAFWLVAISGSENDEKTQTRNRQESVARGASSEAGRPQPSASPIIGRRR